MSTQMSPVRLLGDWHVAQLQGPQSTVPATKSAPQDSHRAALPRQFAAMTTSRCQNAAFDRDVLRFLKTRHTSKNRASTRRRPPPCPKHTAPATKSTHQRKAACVTKNGPRKHEVALAFAAKSSDQEVPKCARHHNKSTVSKSTRSGPPDAASLRSRNALRRSRGE